MAQTDIKLLFGVEGDSSLSEGSGKVIKDQLSEIVKRINDTPFKIKFVADQTSLDQMKKQISTIINSAGARTTQSSSGLTSGAALGGDNLIQYYNNLKKLYSLMNQLQSASIKFESANSANESRGQYKKLQSLIAETDRLTAATAKMTIANDDFSESFASISARATKVLGTLRQFGQTDMGVLSRHTNLIETTKAWAAVEKNISAVQVALEKYSAFDGSGHYTQLQGQAEALTKLQTALSTGHLTKSDFNEALVSIKRYSDDAIRGLKGLQAQAEETLNPNTNSYAHSKAQGALNSQIYGITDALKTYAQFSDNQFYSTLSNQKSAIDALSAEFAKGTMTQDDFNAELAKIKVSSDDAIRGLKGLQAQAELTVPSFGTQFGSAISKQIDQIGSSLGARLLGYAGIMRGAQAVKQMISTAVDLESQMAELRIVTHATDDEYAQFANTVATTAQDVSASISDIISATTTYSRLGYNIEESSALAKFTGMLERVGDIDASSAEDSITSILKAFSDEIDVSEAESVMDRLVVVGNNFPISVSQIATGMTNASSAMAAAGNTFNQSVALLTAANTTIQDASKSSTGLRTITARLRNTKAELDELGETMTSAKYEEIVQLLSDHRVSLMNLNGEYRSTYDIMKDIAAIWDDLSSMEQAALATEVAGVRQQAVFYSLVEQFDEAESAMRSMEESAGSLTNAYAIYEETTAAHLETLGAAWDKLSQDVTASDFNKAAIDLATSIVNVADALARVNGLLPTIIVGIAGIQGLRVVANILKMRAAVDGVVSSAIKNVTATEAERAAVKRLTIQEQQLARVLITKKLALAGASQTAIKDTLANYGLAASEAAVGTAGTAGSVGVTALDLSLKSLMLSNPIGWILTLVGAVISIVPAIQSWTSANEEAKRSISDINEDIDRLVSNSQQVASDFKALKDSTDEIIPRITELSAGVDEHGRNVSLSAEEYSEFIDLQNKLADLFPEIDAGIDRNGNHMLTLAYDVDTLTDSLMALVEAERLAANQEIAGALPELLSLFSEGAGEHELKIKQIEREIEKMSALGENPNFNTSQRVAELKALLSDEIDASDAYASQMWSQISKSIMAYAQTTEGYLGATNVIQDIISDWISGTDWERLGLTTEDEIKSFVNDSIIKPIAEVSEATQGTLQDALSLKAGFMLGDQNVGTTITAITKAYHDLGVELSNNGVSAQRIGQIMSSLGFVNIIHQVDTLKNGLSDSAEDADKFVNSLSSSQLSAAFDIISEKGTMSIADLSRELELASLAGADLVNVLEFTDMFSELDDAASNIDKITSALEKLKDGTALTKQELMKLAQQFPKLLTQSNLFTDGSIAGQQKLLKTVLDAYEKEYDAVIDAKIAELKATLEAVEAQERLELEKSKQIIEINSEMVAGKLENEQSLVDAISVLQNIEGTGYVSMQNGMMQVNKSALETMLGQENDYVAASSEVWSLEAAIRQAALFGIGISDAIAYMNNPEQYATYGNTYGVDAARALEMLAAAMYQNGGFQVGSDGSLVWGGFSVRSGELTWDSSSNTALAEYKQEIQTTIANLEAMRNMTLDEIYASSTGSSSGSSGSGTSSENNWFKTMYEYHKHLVAMDQETTADFLKWLDSAYKTAYNNGEITLSEYYKYQEEVYKGVQTLADNAKDALDRLIEYRIKTLKQERSNEKDILSQKLSDLKDFYDKQKQMLQDQYDEEKYLDEQASRRGTVSSISAQLEQLAYDNSAAAQKKRIELEEELASAQKDLEDFEREHALSDMLDTLDNIYDEQAAEIQAQIDAIEDVVNDPTALYNQALAEIKSNTAATYQALIEYNRANGNGTDDEVKELWAAAVSALAEYKSYTGKSYNGITISGYASGTQKASRGLHRINENGDEVIFQSSDGSTYKMFSGFEKVLTASQSEFLYNFAASGSSAVTKDSSRLLGESAGNTVAMGDIVINGNANRQTISEIRRAQRDQMRNLMRELVRLSR